MDNLADLLPFLPGIPFLGVVVVLYRLFRATVRDLREERADHARTQEQLDAERGRRRTTEDQVAQLTLEVRGLQYEVRQLRTQLDAT